MNKNMLVIGALGAVMLIAVVMFLSNQNGSQPTSTGMVVPSESSAPGSEMVVNPDARTFDITASNFKFSLPQIRVAQGDTVTVTLNTTEGMHDFTLDEFNAKTEQIGAGESSVATFVADKVGTFEYYCSVGNHRQMGMVGTLIVE